MQKFRWRRQDVRAGVLDAGTSRSEFRGNWRFHADPPRVHRCDRRRRAAANAFALPADRFRWAINTNMFTPLKPQPEAGFKMAARFGFHGVEPWANQMQKYLAQPPEVYKKLLDEAGIGISSIASGGEYFDTSKLQATLDDHGANAKFGSYFGITALKANLNNRLGPENLSAANARILAKNLNEVGKRTLEHGVKFAFHPHAWTMVERKAEVEMILEMTDPKLVFLTLDTCHASVGGMEPATFVRDHYSRIAHYTSRTRCPCGARRKAGAVRLRTKKRK